MYSLTAQEREELIVAFQGRYQSPFYADAVEVTVAANDQETIDLKIPSGSEFIPEGLNIEFQAEEDGSCELFVKMQSTNNQRNYIGSPIRASLLATPGSATNGVRFGALPWRGAIPGEDGVSFTVTNNSAESRRISFCFYGKRFIKLSETELNEIKRAAGIL